MAHKAGFGIWSLLPFVTRNIGPFINAYLASIALGLVGLATPLFFQSVIDSAVPYNGRSTLIVIGVGIIIAVLFDTLFSLIHDYLLLHVNPKIDIRITSAVFRHILSLPIGFFDGNRAGSLSRDVQQDRSIRDFLTGRLFFSLSQVTALVVFFRCCCATAPD